MDQKRTLQLLNVGNTHTQIASVENGAITGIVRLESADLTARFPLAPDSVPVYAVCVVPAIRKKLEPWKVHFPDAAAAERAGVDFSAVDTSTLGTDRIANAVALAECGPLPAAVFDFGTAITFEVVDADRRFQGGAIAPGRKLMRQALARGTAQLPEIEWTVQAPERAGRNTREAILLGVDRGAVGLVRELMTMLRRQFGDGIRLLTTGGDSAFFLRELPELRDAGSDFTLRGLLKIALSGVY